jgi:hypothetical protein
MRTISANELPHNQFGVNVLKVVKMNDTYLILQSLMKGAQEQFKVLRPREWGGRFKKNSILDISFDGDETKLNKILTTRMKKCDT